MEKVKPFYHEFNYTVFFICPIGEKDSEIRKRADALMHLSIEPAAEKCGFQHVIRSDKIAIPGEITQEVIQHLIEDDLVIADLHGRNANVFYEVGIRHSVGKPCIQLIDENEEKPFNFLMSRAIELQLADPLGYHEARDLLIQYINNIKSNPHPTNTPVSIAFDMLRLSRSKNLIDVIELLEPTRKARHIIYDAVKEKRTWKHLDKDELDIIDDLCRRFDMLGLYDRLGIVNQYFVDMFYSGAFVEIYENFLNDYVKYLRDGVRGQKHFWELVKFYERVQKVPRNHPVNTGQEDWPDDPRK